MASHEQDQACAPSGVASPVAQADRADGDGRHLMPSAPISATTAERNGLAVGGFLPRWSMQVRIGESLSRDPLTDPRPGDIVADADGVVLEVVDVLLGRGAYVQVREDSSRYPCKHDAWRLITAGGRVIHAAEGQA